MSQELHGLTPLIQVYDMPTSIRFYRDLLGFEIVNHSPMLGEDKCHWVWLRLGKAELMLNTAYESDEERPVPPDAGRVIGHGDIGMFIGCPDVDAAYEELRGKGFALGKPKVARYGMKQLCFQDPDGYGICYQWRVEGS